MSGWGGTARGASRMRHAALMLALTALVAGCALPARTLLTPSAELREQTPLTPVAASQSWINAPDIVMVMQRGLRGESEQRVALASRVAVPGENVILMRARTREGRIGRLSYDEFLRWAGGAPAPFGETRAGDLLSGEDDAGSYFWAEARMGEDVVCVLGLRRLTSAQRLLPAGATTLDILLRNCVRGDAEAALAPLRAGSVSAVPTAGVAAGESRVISPLAAPVVR